MEILSRKTSFSFLKGGGEMGALTRNYNWSHTAIGDPDQWPQSLRTAVSIILNSKLPMFLWWGPELICFYNDAYRPSLGNNGKHPGALGKPGAKVWSEIWPVIKPMIDQVLAGGEATWSEDQLIPIYRNGVLEDVYWTFSYSPVHDESERAAGVLVTCIETTSSIVGRKKVEESENNLRNIILQAPVAMCILKGTSYIMEICNDRMYEFLGTTAEAVLSKPVFEGMPQLKEQGFEALLDTVCSTGETYQAFCVPVLLPRKSGIETVYIDYVYEPFRNGDGDISGVMVVAIEVTKLVMDLKKIEESEARFRSMADAMPQFVWTGDTEGRLNYYNQAVYRYSGLGHEQIQKDGWLQIVHPDDREENIKVWTQAIESGEDFVFQHRFKNAAADYRWQLSRAVPQRNSEGIIQLWIGTSTDIHEQKLFEEELARQVQQRTEDLSAANEELTILNQEFAFGNQQLLRSNEELEQFTYAASHDMQEPLRKVHTFTTFLLENNADQIDERGKTYLAKIGKSVHRMKNIIDDLLNYSHQTREEQQFELVDLNKIIEDIEADLELVIQQKKAVITKDEIMPIKAVATQMTQLFFNLFSNALKFSKPDGPVKITIESNLLSAEEAALLKLPDLQQRYLMIRFCDNGIGFDQQHAAQIFSLFKRLHGKSEYEGTGIGLGLCKKIVQNHQGIIWAESEENKGANFYLVLPV